MEKHFIKKNLETYIIYNIHCKYDRCYLLSLQITNINYSFIYDSFRVKYFVVTIIVIHFNKFFHRTRKIKAYVKIHFFTKQTVYKR